MEFTTALPADLPQLRAVFGEIIRDMDAHGIDIWDDYYPCALFPGDIENGRLHLLRDGDVIVAAFALEEEHQGAESMDWQIAGKALYFDRFGVNVAYRRRGLGGAVLREAVKLARERGADALRLFVVDRNLPALALYERSGFRRAPGIYGEQIDEETTLWEYGYELETNCP